jgi:hypothetical protein
MFNYKDYNFKKSFKVIFTIKYNFKYVNVFHNTIVHAYSKI